MVKTIDESWYRSVFLIPYNFGTRDSDNNKLPLQIQIFDIAWCQKHSAAGWSRNAPLTIVYTSIVWRDCQQSSPRLIYGQDREPLSAATFKTDRYWTTWMCEVPPQSKWSPIRITALQSSQITTVIIVNHSQLSEVVITRREFCPIA